MHVIRSMKYKVHVPCCRTPIVSFFSLHLHFFSSLALGINHNSHMRINNPHRNSALMVSLNYMLFPSMSGCCAVCIVHKYVRYVMDYRQTLMYIKRLSVRTIQTESMCIANVHIAHFVPCTDVHIMRVCAHIYGIIYTSFVIDNVS